MQSGGINRHQSPCGRLAPIFIVGTLKPDGTERLGQFADHLKHLRNEKGLSIRELAARCNVDFSKIGKIEKKKANLTLTTLIELAEGLDMHPKDLLNIDFE